MDPLLAQLLEALARSIDAAKLREALGPIAPSAPASDAPPGSTGRGLPSGEIPADAILGRLLLSDLLDPSILGARQGDRSFPLRVLLSRVGADLARDAAFAFATGLNFYFRAAMDEEAKLRVGLEVSRCFYEFAAEAALSRDEVQQVAPLLATLMNGELARVRFESVDHAAVFDSQLHERAPTADATRSALTSAMTFLCRVAKTGLVRAKAVVCT